MKRVQKLYDNPLVLLVPEKYFYISLAAGLVKFKSTSPTKFLTGPLKMSSPSKTVLDSTENVRFSS